MRVLILGGDGYCGWATALHLSARGLSVALVDNFSRRAWDHQLQVQSLPHLASLRQRLDCWRTLTGAEIPLFVGDVTDYDFLSATVRQYQPQAIIHFAEQRSAPYSMIDQAHAVFTQVNNVAGTLNVLFAIKEFAPE